MPCMEINLKGRDDNPETHPRSTGEAGRSPVFLTKAKVHGARSWRSRTAREKHLRFV